MSPHEKILSQIYRDEKLPLPGILPWPLPEKNEKLRLKREKALKENRANFPVGLSWLESHINAKYRPDKVLSGCRSVLVSHLGYFRNDAVDGDSGKNFDGLGRIARYARGRDYHKELGKRLKRIARRLSEFFPGQSFRSFTDIGPLDEVWLAESCGIGFRGRHGLAILPHVGSWTVLGHIIATVPFFEGELRASPLSCPASCRRCIDACPTDALDFSKGLDASRCIAYHTIEHPGAVPKEFRSASGNWVFGCDICQEACPFNRRVETTEVNAFRQDIAGPQRQLSDLLELKNHEQTKAAFAGSPLMRAGHKGLVRNACTAAGNSHDKALSPQLSALSKDDDPVLRSHALQALAKLKAKA